MFGDLGHGFIAFLAGAYMILNEKKMAKAGLDEITSTFFLCVPLALPLTDALADPGPNFVSHSGRYIIVLMGFFSMFTGLIYNDIFSKSMTIWQSGWEWPHQAGAVEAVQTGVYPFGLDPAWHGTDNALVFTNSYKMKMSIILGVIHVGFLSLFVSALRCR
jgi:V-type H+-transporting ATPase subunit a